MITGTLARFSSEDCDNISHVHMTPTYPLGGYGTPIVKAYSGAIPTNEKSYEENRKRGHCYP